MQITDVRIRKVAAPGKMKAIISVTFDDEFVVHDIKIIYRYSMERQCLPENSEAVGSFKNGKEVIDTSFYVTDPKTGRKKQVKSRRFDNQVSDHHGAQTLRIMRSYLGQDRS